MDYAEVRGLAPPYLGPSGACLGSRRKGFLSSHNEQRGLCHTGAATLSLCRVEYKQYGVRSPLTWKEIKKSLSTNRPITAELNLTDAKGNPPCASVKGLHLGQE